MIDSLQVWEPQNRISHIYEGALKSSEVYSVVSPEAQQRIDKIRADTVETIEITDQDTHEKFVEQRPSKMVVAYQKYVQLYTLKLDEYVTMMGKAVSGSAADVQRASMLGPQRIPAKCRPRYNAWEGQGFKTK